jgi:PDZ domain
VRRRVSILAVVLLSAALWWFLGEGSEVQGPAPTPHQGRTASPAVRVVPAVRALLSAPEVDVVNSEIRCTLGPEFDGWELAMLVRDEHSDGPTPWRRIAGLSGPVLAFPGAPEGSGVLVWDGTSEAGRAEVSWRSDASGTRCEVQSAPEQGRTAGVDGLVVGAERFAEFTVGVAGCGAALIPVDVDGRFFIETVPGPCELVAWRFGGVLSLSGEPVSVDAVAGKDVEVSLTIPDFEPAGIGIRSHAEQRGILVEDVYPGGPADRYGLRPGDMIEAIDGAPTAGMEVDEFIALGVGPAGTAVRVAGTDHQGAPFELELSREVVGRGD